MGPFSRNKDFRKPNFTKNEAFHLTSKLKSKLTFISQNGTLKYLCNNFLILQGRNSI